MPVTYPITEFLSKIFCSQKRKLVFSPPKLIIGWQNKNQLVKIHSKRIELFGELQQVAEQKVWSCEKFEATLG